MIMIKKEKKENTDPNESYENNIIKGNGNCCKRMVKNIERAEPVYFND